MKNSTSSRCVRTLRTAESPFHLLMSHWGKATGVRSGDSIAENGQGVRWDKRCPLSLSHIGIVFPTHYHSPYCYLRHSYRRSKRFLRFLGSEEVSASIDQYGTSDVMVKMMWDAYNNNGTVLPAHTTPSIQNCHTYMKPKSCPSTLHSSAV